MLLNDFVLFATPNDHHYNDAALAQNTDRRGCDNSPSHRDFSANSHASSQYWIQKVQVCTPIFIVMHGTSLTTVQRRKREIASGKWTFISGHLSMISQPPRLGEKLLIGTPTAQRILTQTVLKEFFEMHCDLPQQQDAAPLRHLSDAISVRIRKFIRWCKRRLNGHGNPPPPSPTFIKSGALIFPM